MTRLRFRVLSALGAAGLIGGLLVLAQPAPAEAAPAKHVLLISVDGIHQSDLAWYMRTHPGSGRKSLFLSSHAGRIRGMEEPEARLLLMDLMEHATQPRFVHTHTWRTGDLVMWDNRCTMHQVTAFDPRERRVMHRTTVVGDAPVIAA